MLSKASQIVLVKHGDGFLNGLVPDFACMLDNQPSASTELGSVLFERSYYGDVLRFNHWRGERRIDKTLSALLSPAAQTVVCQHVQTISGLIKLGTVLLVSRSNIISSGKIKHRKLFGF